MPEHQRLTAAVEDYLDHRRAKGRARTTVDNEAFVLRRFAAWYGDVQMRHMTPDKVSSWFYGADGVRSRHYTRDRRCREPVTPGTHNYYRSRLKGFFQFTMQRGWVRVDLLQEVDALRLPRVIRQRPTPAQIAEMIETAPCERDRALLVTLAHTGLRRSEVLRLTVGDVDLEGLWLRAYITKSQLEDVLPMTCNLQRELRRWLDAYAASIGRPLTGSDVLFPARKTGGYRWATHSDGSRTRYRAPDSWQPIEPMTHPERVVQDALRRVGLPTKGEGCHTLRRAAARALFDELNEDSGFDLTLRVVSALLHHSNSTTTERYLGLDPERQRRDAFLRGQEFLASPPAGDVIPFRRHARAGERTP